MQGMLQKPDMHQATREKRKTVTRRLDYLKEINLEPDKWKFLKTIKELGGRQRFRFENIDNGKVKDIYPRYHVDEVVYIKEAHYRYGHWELTGGITLHGFEEYKFISESNTVLYTDNPPDIFLTGPYGYYNGTAWYKRSPLFLPERFARTFIKITDLRPERLQEITEKEARAEGVEAYGSYQTTTWIKPFNKLWDSINPKYPFSSNPWVFRYGYVLLEAK